MQANGEQPLAADPAAVWAALTDLDFLRASLPGCERLAAAGHNRYALALTHAGRRWSGTAQVAEVDAPRQWALDLDLAADGGPPCPARLQLALAADASTHTRLVYRIAAAQGDEAAVQAFAQTCAQRFAARVAARAAADAALGSTPAPRRRTPPRTLWQRLRAWFRRLTGASCCD